ncbi:MAG: hypothetical protein ACOYN0_05465 [Phycisphaerales bacterium]
MRNCDCFEALETRTALSVEASFGGAWTDGTRFYAAVEYTSPGGVDTSTLGNDDVQVLRDNGSAYAAALVTFVPLAGQNGVRAVYSIQAPGKWWDAGDSGRYTTAIRAGGVADLAGGTSVAADIATNNLWFPSAFAALVSTTVDAGSWLINVRYQGVPANAWFGNRIDDGDLSVIDPSGNPLASSLFQQQFIDGAIVATYRVTAPGSTWDAFESGRYSVALRSVQVAPTYFSFLPATPLGDFNLWFGAPRATFDSLTNEGSAVLVKVRFESPTGIDPSSFDDSDLMAVRADGAELSLIRAPEQDVAGSTSYLAAYRLLGPGGAVSNLQAGRYEFILREGAVQSVSGNATPRQIVAAAIIFDDSTMARTASFTIELSALTRDRWADIQLEVPTLALTSGVVTGATFAQVLTPHGLTMNATVTAVGAPLQNGKSIVTVRMLAPDGVFSHHDNGDYAVTVLAGMLRQSVSAQSPAFNAGAFTVSGQSNPRVEILAHRFTTSSWLIDLRLSDDTGIDPACLNSVIPIFASTVQRTGGDRYNLRFSLNSSAVLQTDGSYLITVRDDAPSGTWSWRDTGVARLWMLNPLADLQGNRSGIGEFTSLPLLFDTLAATIAPSYVAAQDRWQVTITYDSPRGFTAGSFHDADVTAVGPNGSLGVARMVAATRLSSQIWSVTYEFGSAMVVGEYTVSLGANAVSDSNGTPVPARTFSPLSVTSVVPPVSVAGAWATSGELYVQVDYANYRSINLATLGVGDISVSRGGQTLTATGLAISYLDSGTARVAYRFAAAGGSWEASDNGAWSVALNAYEVTRTSGEPILGASLHTLNLYFVPPITANLVSSTVTDDAWLVNIRFDGSDPRLSSLSNGDLSIVGRSYMPSELWQVQYLNGAVVATYRFAAPGASWDYEDTGLYTVRLNANAVYDQGGLAVSAVTFPPAYLWFDRPSAYVVSGQPSSTEWLIDVHYGGLGGMDATSLGSDDLTLTGEGRTYSLTILSWNPTTKLARYRVNPVNGSWSAADNGWYTLSVNANAVFGDNGVAAQARTIDAYRRDFA